VIYIFGGMFHKFRPDYLIRLVNGRNLVVEIKGQDTPKDKTKRRYLAEWIDAVNAHGGFGRWAWAVALSPDELPNAIQKETVHR